MIISSVSMEASAATRFKDVPSSYWAYKEIEYLVNKEVINGYKDGTFRLHGQVTRAQAAIMLARALELETSHAPDLGFTDLPKSHYLYKYVAPLVEKGIFAKAKKFNPYNQMSRAEMALVMKRAFKLSGTYTGAIYDVPENTALSSAVHALAANKITTIDERGQFKPSIPLTRVQFSVFLARAMEPKYRPLAIKSDFLKKAQQGILPGCSIPFNKTTTIADVHKKLGKPKKQDYYEGGYGLYYGNCAYFFHDKMLDSKMTGIKYYPNDADLTPARVKQMIGQPIHEGESDMDKRWLLHYDAGQYSILMSADSSKSRIYTIFLKGSSL